MQEFRDVVAEGLLLHIERVIDIIRNLSGDGLLAQALGRARMPSPWDRRKAAHVTRRDAMELIRGAALLSGDPAYAAQLGLAYSSVHAIPGYVARNSRTLGSAILRSRRYIPLSSTGIDYGLTHHDDRVDLWIRSPEPAIDRSFVSREFAVFASLSTLRYIVDREIRPLELTFRHEAPDGGGAIARLAGCAVRWGHTQESLQLSPATLDLPIPTYDERQGDLLAKFGDALLDRAPPPTSAFRAQVETLILDGFGDGAPTAEDVARRLGVSRRTLTRRLAEDGLTFRQLLDDVRLDVAHGYLRHSRLSLAEISFQLGYADQAAFTTAYKRWTGKTPSAARSASA